VKWPFCVLGTMSPVSLLEHGLKLINSSPNGWLLEEDEGYDDDAQKLCTCCTLIQAKNDELLASISKSSKLHEFFIVTTITKI
jgi:hypothetical protein